MNELKKKFNLGSCSVVLDKLSLREVENAKRALKNKKSQNVASLQFPLPGGRKSNPLLSLPWMPRNVPFTRDRDFSKILGEIVTQSK